MRIIKTCAGLGDSVWLMMKLINQPEKFDWQLPDGQPQRGKQLFDLLPQVTNSCSYVPGMGYKVIKRNGYRGKWKDTKNEFFLEANTWLESGRRIEKFLPDLETSFILPYVTQEEDYGTAMSLLGNGVLKYDKSTPDNRFYVDGKYIGIYTSAYSTVRQWDGWQSKEWLELIELIKPLGYKFVLIGADYDIGIPGEIMNEMSTEDYVNTIGQPLPVVIEILKRLDCFIGFPSGLSIINETIGAKQTVMFYPKHLVKMQNTWADPERIESGAYKGCQFCDPKLIFEWLVKNEKI